MQKPKIILGIDPGTQIMGYALLKVEGSKTQVLLMDVLKLTQHKDIYERLEKMHRKINWKAIYFILFAEKNTAQDINLEITQVDFLQRIKRLSHTADIGIHPSYQSNKNPEIMQSERFNLSQVIQKNINSSRQHYLKMQIPNTYYDLIKIGILHDYTMGYASQIGFRASTCRPFPFFDLQANQITFCFYIDVI